MSDRLRQCTLNESLHEILSGEIREGSQRAELDARMLRNLDGMICPITMELMQNPVMNIVSRMTYDGNAMNQYVDSCRQGGKPITDPLTRQVFDPATDLVPNKFARDIIVEWRGANVDLPSPRAWSYLMAGAEVTPPEVLQGHTRLVLSVIQLADGRLASGSWDNTIRIWSTSTEQCEKVLEGHTSQVWSVIQLADGRLASGSVDKTIRIWSTSTGQCEKVLRGHTRCVMSVIQLADGRLASGSEDKTIRIWSTSTGQCEMVLRGHTSSVLSIIQLADGRLASGSGDNTIRIWSTLTGQCKKVLEGHTSDVVSVIQLADGRLASGSDDDTIRIWS
jgi:WD40 repeat protein